jgi:hypothetical protein
MKKVGKPSSNLIFNSGSFNAQSIAQSIAQTARTFWDSWDSVGRHDQNWQTLETCQVLTGRVFGVS